MCVIHLNGHNLNFSRKRMWTRSLVPRPRLPKLRRGPGTRCVRMRRNSRNSRNHRIFSVHDRYTLRHRSLVEQISRLLCCMHSSASDVHI